MALRRLSLALPVLGLALALGCDDAEELRALDATELPERFACEDLTVVAAAPDGSEALLLGIEDGLAAAALAGGEVVHADYELPDERLTVRWVAGSNVYQGHCGRDNGGRWQLDARLDALEGRVVVSVEPHGDGTLTVDAEFVDVILASEEHEWETELLVAQTRFETLPVD